MKPICPECLKPTAMQERVLVDCPLTDIDADGITENDLSRAELVECEPMGDPGVESGIWCPDCENWFDNAQVAEASEDYPEEDEPCEPGCKACDDAARPQ